MNGKKPGIISYVIKVPVLFFYVTFFIVEIFFNNGTGNVPNNSLLFQKNASVGHNSFCINKSNKGKDKKQTFHLNRRFQPKDVLNCNLVVFKFPDYYLERKIFVSKYDLFIPATDLLSQSYRGPPVVS
jgi:hypothetical protein